MKRRILAPLSALLVVGLVGVLTACGSSSKSSSSPATTAAAGNTAPAETTPKETKNVQLMLDWVPNPDHLALYATQAAA